MRQADALVVGAGPAGVATALSLARHGLAVRVIDRRRGPLDKACGEGIMPAGVRALESLGVRWDATRAAPFVGVRFVEGELRFEGRFASGVGLGVRRTALSRALHDAAHRAGVELELGCGLEGFEASPSGILARTTSGPVRARLLIGADGLASRVRRSAGLDAPARSRRFGLRRHFRVAPWSPFVEVHWRPDAEAYVTPVADDEVGVAILGAGKGRSYTRDLAAFPQLAERLRDAAPASEVRGAGPFWRRARALTAEGVALVGDAAGYTDAVTGEGITLAVRAGERLGALFARTGSTAGYERAWRQITREHRALAALLAFGVAHPRARRAAFGLLARSPHVFEWLLRRAASEGSTHAAGRSGPRLAPVSERSAPARLRSVAPARSRPPSRCGSAVARGRSSS